MMLPLDYTTEEIAIRILAASFETNLGVRAFVKEDHHIKSRIFHLCTFCVRVARKKQGAYITSNRKGVALMFNSENHLTKFDALSLYAYLGQYSVGWLRAIPMLKRERIIKSYRSKEPAFYFWMLAVEDQSFGLETIIEIKEFVFQRSRANRLDIIAETISKRTLAMYLRYGFEVYHEYQDSKGLIIYFIRRPWNR